jgi:hypothetical protein
MAAASGDVCSPRRLDVLDLLAAVVALAAVVCCFHGRGSAFTWMRLALVLPTIRGLCSPAYRLQLAARLRVLWSAVERYPHQTRRVPWLSTSVFVVGPGLLLFLSTNRYLETGDTWPVVPMACSLVRQGSANLDDYVQGAPSIYRAGKEGLPYCVRRAGNHVYSGYQPGMVHLALPVVAVARLVGADLSSHHVRNALEKWTAAWAAALTLGLFFLVALHLAPARAAWLVSLLLATGSVLLTTVGQRLWQHDGLILWSMVLLLVEFHRRQTWSWGGLVLQSLGGSLMLACRLTAVLILVPFGLWMFVRQPRRAVAFGLLAGLFFLPWALLFASIYGTPLGPSTSQLEGNSWTIDLTGALPGLLLSPSHGLLVYQPWLLLGLLGLLPLPRGGRAAEAVGPTGWPWFCLSVMLLQLALVSCWRCWYGGDCWGSRLLAEVVPLLALLCLRPVALLGKHRAGQFALGCLLLLSFFLQAVGVYGHPHWMSSEEIQRDPGLLWSWSRAPFLPAHINRPWRHSERKSIDRATLMWMAAPSQIERVLRLMKPRTMPATMAPQVSSIGLP